MASSLAGPPVQKEAFFEALSSRERSGAAELDGEADADYRQAAIPQEYGDESESDRLQEEESGDEVQTQRDPQLDDSGAEQTFQEFLEAEDDEYGGGASPTQTQAWNPTLKASNSTARPRGEAQIVVSNRGPAERERTLADQRTIRNVERLRQDFRQTSQAAEDAKYALDEEQQKLRVLKKQLEADTLADPARLSQQEKLVSQAWDRLTQAEKARDAADLALHRVTDEAGAAAWRLEQAAAQEAALAQERHAHEVKRARRLAAKEAAALRAEHKRQDAIAAEQERKDVEARKHQKLGQTRLREAQATLRERNAEADRVKEAQFQRDAQRVVALKSNVDSIRNDIESSNERRLKKQLKVKEEREMQKASLLSSGLNPYEVWRKEEMEGKKEKEKAKMLAQTELHNEKLVKQLLEEDRRYKKKVKEEAVKQQHKEQWQKEVGNFTKQKKIAAYIRKMTIGNVEVLDPTGKALRIDASKVTVQKTHAFGLGRAGADEIDKVEKKVRTATQRLEARQPVGSPDSVTKLVGNTPLPAFADDDDDSQDEMEDPSSYLDGEAPREIKKLWVPKLTKLEEQYMAAARERQKQNITSVQRCWGKEFTGQAFLTTPAVIEFKDFEVGKRYRQVVQITNVSLTFNQFKLLPLDDAVKDFFEIQFVPPGRMSAGVTRYITIWFVPKVPTDISTKFPVLAKTGPMDFPIVCTTKKTLVSVTPQDMEGNPLVDFGQVLSGESGQCKLRAKNLGALAAQFELIPQDHSDALKLFTWSPHGGEFSAHSTTEINFSFRPRELGRFKLPVKLTIANGAEGDAKFAQDLSLVITGSCVDVPIFAEKDVYDMKTCVVGHVYRENVVIKNRQSIAMKISVKEPVEIKDELTLSTTTAFIQGNKDQVIAVKFCPRKDFLHRHPQYQDSSRPEVDGAFRIPMQILGVDQVLPVPTALAGTLTSNGIRIEPPTFSFGRCQVGSAVIFRFSLKNESLLPQKFAFVQLPRFLEIEDVPLDVQNEEEQANCENSSTVLECGPNGTFGSLLPLERRQLFLTWTPETSTEMNHKLVMKAICGAQCVGEFYANCSGQGVAPTIRLSHTQVEMASIPRDTVSKDSVIVTNVSKATCMVSIILPPEELSGLRGCPICWTLEPEESRRLQLEFKPTQEYIKLLERPKPAPMAEPGQGADGAVPAEDPEVREGGGEAEGADAAESKAGPTSEDKLYLQEKLREIRENGGRRWEAAARGTIHASWKIAVCSQPAQGSGKAAAGGGTLKAETQQRGGAAMYLAVRTCMLPSTLIPDPVVLDFGEVTAQDRKVLPLRLENKVLDPQDLRIEPLPENQCFTVLNAARTIGAKPFNLMVEFNPQLVQIYQSVLQLRTQSTRVQVPLRGRGVRPVLHIEPADGILHLGAVIYSKECKDYTTTTLEIKNASPFELHYSLETVLPTQQNHTGPSPFTLSPRTGTVQANGKRTVTVTFRPHRPLLIFKEKLLVKVPSQKEPTYVYLYGHCFKFQNYAMYDVPLGPFGKADVHNTPAFVDGLAVGAGSGLKAVGDFEYPKAMEKAFALRFGEEENVKHLVLGACVPPGTPTAPQNAPGGSYELKIEDSEFSKLFTIEPEGGKADKVAKGALPPGKPLKVAFRYAAPQNTSLACGDLTLDLLKGIGQWVTCSVKGVLAGGFVPPPNDAKATQEFTVELKAYLQQI